MTYSQVLEKIQRVFKSCETKEQIFVAHTYCYMLSDEYYQSYKCGGTECTVGRLSLLDFIDKVKRECLNRLT